MDKKQPDQSDDMPEELKAQIQAAMSDLAKNPASTQPAPPNISQPAAKPKKAALTGKVAEEVEEVKSAMAKTKPIQVERSAGRFNLLILNQWIREIFRVLCWSVFVGSLVWSVVVMVAKHGSPKARLQLIPKAVKAFGLLVPAYLAHLTASPKGALITLAVIIVVIASWLKSKTSVIFVLVNRLAMLAFWLLVAYWLISVVGFGQTIPTYLF